MDTKPTLNSLAERRFTIAARILTDANVEVKIGEFPNAGACAWWQHETNQVWLNECAPYESNPVKSLIFNRGKLFHELAHKLFTNAYDYRNELERKAKDRKLFDVIRQTLEDGYIEQRIAKQWQGATPYIRSLLMHVLQSDKTKFGALAIFVRTFVWRDAEAKKSWGRWEKLIRKAVHSDSRGVCDAAFEIAEAMAEEKEQGNGKGGDNSKGNPTQSDEEEKSGDPETSDAEGEDKEGKGGDAEGEGEGDAEGEGEEESEGSGEECGTDSSGGSDSGKPTGSEGAGGEETKAEIAENIKALIQKVVEEALEEASPEAEAEYNEMMEEIALYAPTQDYATPEEESAAERIAEVLHSTLVESNRQKWIDVRRCGSFNSRRIVNAISGGTCLRQRQSTEDLPHIALLLDVSGSMAGAKITQISEAGRVLNGAVAQVAAKSMVASFSSCTRILETVPVHGLSTEGSTDTDIAINRAVNWLETQQATKGLIIIATDGHPDDEDLAAAEFRKAAALGYYVLGVWIGGFKPRENNYCHESLVCKDIRKLPELLTQPLQQFVAQAF